MPSATTVTFVSAAPVRGVFALSARRSNACGLRRARRSVRNSAATPPPTPADDDADSGEAESGVDWNESWSRFRSAGMSSDAPAGRAAVTPRQRAARQAGAKARNALEGVRASVPSRQELFRDWRFWVAVLFALSAFTAFVNYSAAPAPTGVI